MSGGSITLLQDLTDNDSDKTFTVPSDTIYEVLYASAELITTGTVGNRQLTIDIGDGTEVIHKLDVGAVHAASTTVDYLFAPGYVRETTVVSGTLHCPIPPKLFLLPGYTIRVYDSAAVDAAADDMDVSIMVRKLPENHKDVT